MVVRLPHLEVDVRVLHGVAQGGVVGIQGVVAELLHRLPSSRLPSCS